MKDEDGEPTHQSYMLDGLYPLMQQEPNTIHFSSPHATSLINTYFSEIRFLLRPPPSFLLRRDLASSLPPSMAVPPTRSTLLSPQRLVHRRDLVSSLRHRLVRTLVARCSSSVPHLFQVAETSSRHNQPPIGKTSTSPTFEGERCAT